MIRCRVPYCETRDPACTADVSLSGRSLTDSGTEMSPSIIDSGGLRHFQCWWWVG